MSKRQTRRSISVKGITYQRLSNHCRRVGKPICAYVEDVVGAALDAVGEPVPERVEPRPQKPGPDEDGHIASGIFTF